MNKTPRLSNSDIEYLDKVWNFSSGCGKGCPYCYAKKITKRFTNHYSNEFEPTLYPEALLSPLYLKKPSRIGVCYMGDLFWDCPEFDPERKNILNGFTEEGSQWSDISLKRIINYVVESAPSSLFPLVSEASSPGLPTLCCDCPAGLWLPFCLSLLSPLPDVLSPELME